MKLLWVTPQMKFATYASLWYKTSNSCPLKRTSSTQSFLQICVIGETVLRLSRDRVWSRVKLQDLFRFGKNKTINPGLPLIEIQLMVTFFERE